MPFIWILEAYISIPKLLFLTEITNIRSALDTAILFNRTFLHSFQIFLSHFFSTFRISSRVSRHSIFFFKEIQTVLISNSSIPLSRLTKPRIVRKQTSNRRGMCRGKARCARSIIIHPAHYPSTGTIDEPTPMLVRPAVPYFAFDEMEI